MNVYWIKIIVNIMLWVATWIVVHTKICSLKDYFCGEEALDILFVASLFGTIICMFIPYVRILPFVINTVAIIVMFNIDHVVAGCDWFIALGKGTNNE